MEISLVMQCSACAGTHQIELVDVHRDADWNRVEATYRVVDGCRGLSPAPTPQATGELKVVVEDIQGEWREDPGGAGRARAEHPPHRHTWLFNVMEGQYDCAQVFCKAVVTYAELVDAGVEGLVWNTGNPAFVEALEDVWLRKGDGSGGEVGGVAGRPD